MKIIKVSALQNFMFNFSIPLSSYDISNTFETSFYLCVAQNRVILISCFDSKFQFGGKDELNLKPAIFYLKFGSIKSRD